MLESDQLNQDSCLKILIVEDDPDLLSTLVQVLQEENYAVDAVGSGLDAINLAAKGSYDLLITDIKLPGVNGLAALEQIKANSPATAGIVITGYSTEEDAVRAARLRVENYLTKPFRIDDFLTTVERIAQEKKKKQLRLNRQRTQLEGIRWLTSELVFAKVNIEPNSLANKLDSYVKVKLSECQDSTEKLAASNAMLWAILETYNLQLPDSLWANIPEHLAYLREGSMAKKIKELAAELLNPKDDELPEANESVEAEDDNLGASLLSIALALEGSGHIQEASQAFLELQTNGNPYSLYHASFGLARLARRTRQLSELRMHLENGVKAARELGPLAECQALTEQGILLALSGGADGLEPLNKAVSLAKQLKETSSYAIGWLALAHFYQTKIGNPARYLKELYRIEHFASAVDAAGWLIEYLLGCELDEIGQKFLQKLIRSAPKSFYYFVEKIEDEKKALKALDYLNLATEPARNLALHRFQTFNSLAIRKQVENYKLGTRDTTRNQSMLRLFSFSGIQAFRDDEQLPIQRKKPLTVLLFMLVRNAPIGEALLIEQFWPGDETKGRMSLRSNLYYLRKLIAPEELNLPDPIERRAPGLSISKEIPIWFDYWEFNSLIERGKGLTDSLPQRAIEFFRSACRLYRGPFLENIYDDWALTVREQCQADISAALQFLARQSLAIESWAEAHEHALRGLHCNELDQPFYELDMLALIKLGRQHEALRLYEQASTLLERELSLEPSIEMIRLRELAKLNI